MTSQARMKRPARARERIRLAAALGILAAAAIAVGGIASLVSGTPMLPQQDGAAGPERDASEPAARSAAWIEAIEDSSHVLDKVEDAEASVARARAAIERARERGELDPTTLSSYEARLDKLGIPEDQARPLVTDSARPPAEVSPRRALRPAVPVDRGL